MDKQKKVKSGRRRYLRQIKEIQETLGVSYNSARESWSYYYKKGGKQRRPLVPIAKADVKSSPAIGAICPFCRDDLYDADERLTCDGCSVTYHEECLTDELRGRCGTLGCRARSSSIVHDRSSPVTGRIVITPGDIPTDWAALIVKWGTRLIVTGAVTLPILSIVWFLIRVYYAG